MNATLRTGLLALTVLTALLGLFGSCATAPPLDPPPSLAGTWVGDGRVHVDWVRRKRLAVTLTITEGGAVTGRVGDAQLVDAHVRPNRSELGRTLGVWTDWAVEGRLQDELLADEQFVAQRVLIPFNAFAGRIEGRVHAEGAFLDGRRGGRLDVVELTLQRR